MNLEEVQAGRQVFSDGLSAGAIYFTSPLSLPFALEALVPAFASTLAGEGPANAFGAPLLDGSIAARVARRRGQPYLPRSLRTDI